MPSSLSPALSAQQVTGDPYATSQPARTDRASLIPTLPEPHLPPLREVPDFPPIRAGGRGRGLLRRRVRGLSVVLAGTAAALAVSAAHGAAPPTPPVVASGPVKTATHHPPGESLVRAPVRIADAGTASLLRPGDRVDVLAGAHVVAMSAAVVTVPAVAAPLASATGTDPAAPTTGRETTADGGALVVLRVPRKTAAALSGAAASTPLAVTLC